MDAEIVAVFVAVAVVVVVVEIASLFDFADPNSSSKQGVWPRVSNSILGLIVADICQSMTVVVEIVVIVVEVTVDWAYYIGSTDTIAASVTILAHA